jgi:hypothetical protein
MRPGVVPFEKLFPEFFFLVFVYASIVPYRIIPVHLADQISFHAADPFAKPIEIGIGNKFPACVLFIPIQRQPLRKQSTG